MRVRDVFEFIDGRRNTRWEDARGVFRFDVVDVGTWWVEVDDGLMRTHEGEPPRADCVVRGLEADLLRLLTGEANLVTAFIRGEVGIAGDPTLIKRFHGMLQPRGTQGEARA